MITNTKRRVKRQSVKNTGSQMSNGDATEIVALHNEYRAKRGAADMEYMVKRFYQSSQLFFVASSVILCLKAASSHENNEEYSKLSSN